MFIVSGGFAGSSTYLDSTEIFDPDVGSWRAGAALPSPMASMGEAKIFNRVFVFGIDILLQDCALCIFDLKYLQVVMTEVVLLMLFLSMTSLATPILR